MTIELNKQQNSIISPPSPPAENYIISTWDRTRTRPLVSIVCATYNHFDYISDAINSFLMQKTNFPFEVLINDDASTDGTTTVVQDYAKRYPNIIKLISHKENQYSQGISPNKYLYPLVQGEYIALCEGDDYWISEHKLQEQVDTIESYPNISLVIHPAIKLDQQTQYSSIIGKYSEESTLLTVDDIILKKCGQIPTASTLFKSELLPTLNNFFETYKPTVGDIYIHFLAAHHGRGAVFLPKPMSVYRVNIPISWNNRISNNFSKQTDHIINRTQCFFELNKKTNEMYKDALNQESYRSCRRYLLSNAPYSEKKRAYNKFSKYFKIKYRLKLYSLLHIHLLLPTIKNIKKSL